MITIISGDLLNTSAKYICHQVNCQGVMGGGVALQIKNLYPEVFSSYLKYIKNHKDLLGTVLPVQIDSGQIILNLFSQYGCGFGMRNTNYDAMKSCLRKILDLTEPEDTIAMPYLIGCGLGGGDWTVVYSLIDSVLSERKVELYKL